MTDYRWKSGISGDWLNAADWTGGKIPDSATAAVTIGAVGTYAVTIGATEEIKIEYLTITAANVSLDVVGSLQSDGITLSGSDDTLAFQNDATLNEAIVLSTGDTLIAGSALTFNSENSLISSGTDVLAAATILNDGNILVQSGELSIDVGMFVNTFSQVGVGITGLTIDSGATLSILTSDFQNDAFMQAVGGGTALVELASASPFYATGTLSGGSYGFVGADAGSTLALEFQNGGSIVTDDTSVYLDGEDSEVVTVNPKTGKETNIEASLRTIGSGGVLDLVHDSFKAKNDIDIGGAVYLGFGTFSAPVVDILNSGNLQGAGKVKGAITNDGSILSGGDKLEIEDAISGTGILVVDGRDGDLQLDAATAENVDFVAYNSPISGRLVLEDPSGFTGTINALTKDFIIDIAPTTVSAATVSHDLLMITLTGGAMLDYAFSPLLTNVAITIKSDNKHGSYLDFTQSGQPVASPASTGLLDFANMRFIASGVLDASGTHLHAMLPDLDSALSESQGAEAPGLVSTVSASGLHQALSLTDRIPLFLNLLEKAEHFLS